MPNSELPSASLDLLIRIDERLKGVDEKLDRIERRDEDHERRLSVIEKDISDRDRLKSEFFKAQHDIANLKTVVQIIQTSTQVNQTWMAKLWENVKLPASVLLGFLILSYAEAELKKGPPQAPATISQSSHQ